MLRTAGLTVVAGGRELCRGLDLSVAAGELWAVLGCNGSGKTTLLHTLAGLAPAASGHIWVLGKPLAAYPRRALGCALGILLQHEPEEFWGSLAEYVMLGRHPHAHSILGPVAPDVQAVALALAEFDLEALAGRSYVTLSGGERQRARLAQLWAQRPALMLLDEPLQHLDLRHQLQTMELLRQAARDRQCAALLVLHDLTYAGRCDHMLMMYGDGRFAAGRTEDLLQPQMLESLYGCHVRAFGSGTDVHFIPVI